MINNLHVNGRNMLRNTKFLPFTYPVLLQVLYSTLPYFLLFCTSLILVKEYLGSVLILEFLTHSFEDLIKVGWV